METLTAVSRWLAKQHVVTWYVHRKGKLWYVNAFYLFDAQKMVFYMLTKGRMRHAQMSGPRASTAGTVNGQPETIALIHDVQLRREIRRLEGQGSEGVHKAYNRCFPVAGMLPAPVWGTRLDEVKFTGNALGFGKEMYWLHSLQLEE